MAQKPYKYQIEYIQKFYSYGSEAKVIEFKPVYKEEPKPVPPKFEKEPATRLCIDPLAFCGLMVAVVMLVVMLSGIIRFNVVAQDHMALQSYVNQLREDNALLSQRYAASYDLDEMDVTARALGMIPISEAQTISMKVEVPVREEKTGFIDNVIWFLSGLLE